MRALLVEEVIAKDRIEIDIDYGVFKTQHSSQRQSRHGEEDIISNEEITYNIKGAFKTMAISLLFDTLNIGEPVAIKNLDTYLNIVGTPLRGQSKNSIIFKIITVMRKENFAAKEGTKIIRLRNRDLKNNE